MARHMDVGKDIRLIFDLIWTRLPDDSMTTVRESAASGATHFSLMKVGEEVMAGYIAMDKERVSRQQISFAAAVASQYKEEGQVLLVVDLVDDESILIGINNGMPVPDFDRYGPRADIRAAAMEFREEHPGARLVGDTSIFEGSNLEIDLFDINDFLTGKQAKAVLKQCSLRPIRSGTSVNPLFLIVAVLIAGGIGYDMWATQKAKREAEAAAANAIPPEQIYADGFSAAASAEGMTPAEARATYRRMSLTEVEIDGWRVKEFRCTKSGCQAQWIRQYPSATFAQLAGGLKMRGITPVFAADQTATTQMPPPSGPAPAFAAPAPVPAPGLAPAPAAAKGISLLALENEPDVWVKLLKPLQALGPLAPFNLTAGTKFTVSGVAPSNAAKRGEVRVKGSLWLAEYLERLPDTVRVRDMTISADAEKPSLTMTVVYFAKG